MVGRDVYLAADFLRYYQQDWFRRRERDPIGALCDAAMLPPEAAFKRAILDPTRWTEEMALHAMIELDLRRLIYLVGFTVDGKTYNNANGNDSMPSEPYTPDDVLEAYEEAKAWEKQQERSAAAEAVISDQDRLNAVLSAPRVKIESNPELAEDEY